MAVRGFRDLLVWQRAMDFVDRLYGHAKRFPTSEVYGLTSQLKRSAVSVPSNIAEGHSRGSRRDYLRFLYMARGSCAEIETQLEIARRQGMIDNVAAQSLIDDAAELGRLLTNLIKALNRGLK